MSFNFSDPSPLELRVRSFNSNLLAFDSVMTELEKSKKIDKSTIQKEIGSRIDIAQEKINALLSDSDFFLFQSPNVRSNFNALLGRIRECSTELDSNDVNIDKVQTKLASIQKCWAECVDIPALVVLLRHKQIDPNRLDAMIKELIQQGETQDAISLAERIPEKDRRNAKMSVICEAFFPQAMKERDYSKAERLVFLYKPQNEKEVHDQVNKITLILDHEMNRITDPKLFNEHGLNSVKIWNIKNLILKIPKSHSETRLKYERKMNEEVYPAIIKMIKDSKLMDLFRLKIVMKELSLTQYFAEFEALLQHPQLTQETFADLVNYMTPYVVADEKEKAALEPIHKLTQKFAEPHLDALITKALKWNDFASARRLAQLSSKYSQELLCELVSRNMEFLDTPNLSQDEFENAIMEAFKTASEIVDTERKNTLMSEIAEKIKNYEVFVERFLKIADKKMKESIMQKLISGLLKESIEKHEKPSFNWIGLVLENLESDALKNTLGGLAHSPELPAEFYESILIYVNRLRNENSRFIVALDLIKNALAKNNFEAADLIAKTVNVDEFRSLFYHRILQDRLVVLANFQKGLNPSKLDIDTKEYVEEIFKLIQKVNDPNQTAIMLMRLSNININVTTEIDYLLSHKDDKQRLPMWKEIIKDALRTEKKLNEVLTNISRQDLSKILEAEAYHPSTLFVLFDYCFEKGYETEAEYIAQRLAAFADYSLYEKLIANLLSSMTFSKATDPAFAKEHDVKEITEKAGTTLHRVLAIIEKIPNYSALLSNLETLLRVQESFSSEMYSKILGIIIEPKPDQSDSERCEAFEEAKKSGQIGVIFNTLLSKLMRDQPRNYQAIVDVTYAAFKEVDHKGRLLVFQDVELVKAAFNSEEFRKSSFKDDLLNWMIELNPKLKEVFSTSS